MHDIRDERAEDIGAIHAITNAAFAGKPYSSQTEARIVDALRQHGALTLSLVATRGGTVVGHVAFSPVTIDGRPDDWYGLGPVSVVPHLQDTGIGSALIRTGLARLGEIDAAGCVLLGNPGYYARFGFANDPGLTYDGGSPPAFQRLVLRGQAPTGAVRFHPAFDVV